MSYQDDENRVEIEGGEDWDEGYDDQDAEFVSVGGDFQSVGGDFHSVAGVEFQSVGGDFQSVSGDDFKSIGSNSPVKKGGKGIDMMEAGVCAANLTMPMMTNVGELESLRSAQSIQSSPDAALSPLKVANGMNGIVSSTRTSNTSGVSSTKASNKSSEQERGKKKKPETERYSESKSNSVQERYSDTKSNDKSSKRPSNVSIKSQKGKPDAREERNSHVSNASSKSQKGKLAAKDDKQREERASKERVSNVSDKSNNKPHKGTAAESYDTREPRLKNQGKLELPNQGDVAFEREKSAEVTGSGVTANGDIGHERLSKESSRLGKSDGMAVKETRNSNITFSPASRTSAKTEKWVARTRGNSGVKSPTQEAKSPPEIEKRPAQKLASSPTQGAECPPQLGNGKVAGSPVPNAETTSPAQQMDVLVLNTPADPAGTSEQPEVEEQNMTQQSSADIASPESNVPCPDTQLGSLQCSTQQAPQSSEASPKCGSQGKGAHSSQSSPQKGPIGPQQIPGSPEEIAESSPQQSTVSLQKSPQRSSGSLPNVAKTSPQIVAGISPQTSLGLSSVEVEKSSHKSAMQQQQSVGSSPIIAAQTSPPGQTSPAPNSPPKNLSPQRRAMNPGLSPTSSVRGTPKGVSVPAEAYSSPINSAGKASSANGTVGGSQEDRMGGVNDSAYARSSSRRSFHSRREDPASPLLATGRIDTDLVKDMKERKEVSLSIDDRKSMMTTGSSASRASSSVVRDARIKEYLEPPFQKGERKIWRNSPKFPTQTDEDPEWWLHSNHVFVFTFSGRPVYTRYGDDEKLAQFCGVLSVIAEKMSKFFSRSGNQDVLKSMSTGTRKFVFHRKGPLWLLCVSSHGQEAASAALETLLQRVYRQLITIVTNTMERNLQKKPNLDIRPQLGGTQHVIGNLVRWCFRDMLLHVDGVEPLPLDPAHRNVCTETLRSTRLKNLCLGFILGGHRIVSLVSDKNTKNLYDVGDLQHVINYILSSNSLRTTQTWTPICLPSISEQAFTYAYIEFLHPEQDICLCFISYDMAGQVFMDLSETASRIKRQLTDTGVLTAIGNSIAGCPVEIRYELPRRCSYLYRDFQGSLGHLLDQVIHGSYYLVNDKQYFKSSVKAPYDLKYIFRNYGKCRELMQHCELPCEICVATDNECFYVWLKQDFHLYLTVPRGISTSVIGQFYQWVKSQEMYVFIHSMGQSWFVS